MPNGNPIEWGKLIQTVGFPIAVAMILLATFFGWLPSPMLTEHKHLVDILGAHTREDGTRTFLLRQICQNVSTNKDDARKCLQDSYEGR